ncbi:hypothetical protein [Actinomadura roseirufa]|uniref:hypothetical protein n=1 Tax=Actinomadura roseirufa TaxID=2094049 RepID=UPI0010419424|nr:hypothetical protein [Actinomadura roseirufa]
MRFAGDFEAHLTVHHGVSAEEVAAWAAGRGMKFTHIVLERGRVASQPMLTVRCRGTLDEALVQAERTAARLDD